MEKKNTKSAKESQSKKKTRRKIIQPHMLLFFHTKSFLNDLKCAKEMYEVIVPSLKKIDDRRKKKVNEDLKILKQKQGSKKNIEEATKDIIHVNSLIKTIQKINRAKIMFGNNSIVLLLAKFDEYLTAVLKVIFRANPNQLKSSEKVLSYEEIFESKSLESVFDKFISKEIEKLLRESHQTQLEYLDNRLKLGLKDHFPYWNDFIEISERRNLFVHAGGQVNRHYLNICNELGIKLDSKIKENSVLHVTDEYFENAYQCLFELGVRIGQSVYRRLFPKKLEEADTALINDIGVSLEEEEQWELADKIFKYALNLSPKLYSDDHNYKIFVINSCICLNALNKKNEMRELLEKFDWSSANEKLLFGVHILKKEYSEAEKIMSSMEKDKIFKEHDFHSLPIFNEFRKTENFLRAFKKLYRRDYRPIIKPML